MISFTEKAATKVLSIMNEQNVSVVVLPGLDEHPDCTFVEDTAVVVGNAVVIPYMGHPSREGEQVAVRDLLSECLEVIQMPEGATMDIMSSLPP